MTLPKMGLICAVLAGLALPTHASRCAGRITLSVDATDAPGNLLHCTETLDATPGAFTLYYPKWIPGEHGPTGPIADLVGLNIRANGATLSWRRDLVDMDAIHINVPAGPSQIDVKFDFILPPESRGFSSAGSSTPALLVLSWNQVVLYPERERPDAISVTPSLALPAGWKFGTALEVESRTGDTVRFKAVPLTELIDSPVLCGEHFRRVDVTPEGYVPHHIDMVSDDEAAINMAAPLVEKYRNLVVQANTLFGGHHYRHYDFLYTLSDHTAHFGLEHHQSSDNRVGERTVIDASAQRARAGLLPHEFVHSWNGKYRRPADLATGDYSTPMKDDMLWVYEGLTEYLGDVLTARSGLWSPEEYREHLALVAAAMDNTPGRTWRPLQDAADEASVLYEAREDWESYRRGVDFYDEGELIWLEADVTIRRETGGKKSLGDFCRLFYGGTSINPWVEPYTFDDVVKTLNQVAKHDWRSFFERRLQSLDPHAPLGGIEGGGWKLVYRDAPSAMQEARDAMRKYIDFRYSLGLLINDDGILRDVVKGSPASRAGVIPTMKLVAVNGRAYTPELLCEVIRSAKGRSEPIRLLTLRGEYYKIFDVGYHDGPKYPYLERVSSKPDVLDQIVEPLVGK